MTGWSEAETIALATRAARGAGLHTAQASLYGAAAARHLAAGRQAASLGAALDAAAGTSRLLTRVLSLAAGRFSLPVHPLTCSALECLPGCISYDIADMITGIYHPQSVPAARTAARLEVPDTLALMWESLALRTYVPESAVSRAGAGAAES